MKRRQLLKSAAAVPAVATLAQAQTPSPEAAATSNPSAPGNSLLAETTPDTVAEGAGRFLSEENFAALSTLAGMLMPPLNGQPGALQARAPEFLDFLISKSPERRQHLYRSGLNALNGTARSRYGKSFAQLSADEAAPLLEPLHQAWTYQPPKDALSEFLRAAKEDVFAATVNSREFAAASQGRRRSASGLGAYWLAME